MDHLGPARKTTTEQRRFLNALSARYQRHVDDSLQGNYDSELEPGHSLKLRKHLQDLGDEFAESMRKKGHTYVFRTAANVEDKEYRYASQQVDASADPVPVVSDDSDAKGRRSLQSRLKAARKAKASGCNKSTLKADSSLSGSTLPEATYPFMSGKDAEDGIYAWIRRNYRESRGAELPGTVNPVVLQNLFKQQSRSWAGIAATYLKKVHDVIDCYNKAVFKTLIAEREAQRSLHLHLAYANKNAIAKSQFQLDGLIADERGTVSTLNHYYAETLEKLRKDRVMARLQKMGVGDGEATPIKMKEILSATTLSNEDQAVNDIHDILKSYYKVACKRFVDNGPNTNVERELIRSQKGLLRYFGPEHVGAMSDDELAFVAAETYSTSTSRADNTQKAERFRQALEMAKKLNA